MRTRIRRLIRLLMPSLLPLALLGCPQQYPDPLAAEGGDPKCGTDQLAKLISGRAIELNQVCGPIKVANCHSPDAERIRAEYSKKFDEWERCK